jgi:membrane-associated phospholipid phosphatase
MATRTTATPRAVADRRRDAASTQARGAIFPVLDGDGHGLTVRAAEVLGRDRPVGVFFVGLLIAYVAILGASVLLGLLLTHVFLSWGGLASSDERFVVWLSHHRSSGLTDASLIGSIIAGGVVLPVVAGSSALAAAVLRQWRLAGFFVFVLALESAVYRATTLVVHRDRPAVHRLEQLPLGASYFSGHTAAAIAVYCGLALLLTSLFRNLAFRTAAWCVALLIVAFDVYSRLYRGMHHPLDVAGGVVVGVAAVWLLVLTCRAAGAADSA